MKITKHNPVYGWTGASQDASARLRGAVIGFMKAVPPRDMVKN